MSLAANGKRLALVTGSTGLLGRAICHRLAEQGIDLCLGHLSSQEAAQEQAQTLSDTFGVACSLAQLDVTSPASVQGAVNELIESRGQIDMLVAAHGVAPHHALRFSPDEEIQNAFRINAEGTVYCVRAVLPIMQRQRWGRIVLLGSAATEGRVGQAVYAASKAALVGLARSAAREYAKYGITVNVLAPAVVEGGPATQGEERAKLLESYPLGRFVLPEEVAATVAFLVSEEAASITGQQLILDGGRI